LLVITFASMSLYVYWTYCNCHRGNKSIHVKLN
jgi:hypothetical protein